MDKKIIGYIKNTVIFLFLGLSLCFLLWLFLASAFSNVYMENTHRILYIYDNPLCNYMLIIGLLALLTIITYLIKRFHISWPQKFNKETIIKVIFVLGSVLSVIILLCISPRPESDQSSIFSIAQQMHQGIFTEFEDKGYACRYPVQLGMIVYIYVLQGIFGTNNVLAIQIMNCLFLVVAWYSLYYFSKEILKTNSIVTSILIILFFPLTIYVTYVYGILIGFSCSLAAICFQYRYFRTGKVINEIVAVLLLAIGVLIKSNFLIFAVGTMGYLFLHSLMNKKFLHMVWIPVFIGVYFVMSFCVTNWIQNQVDHKYVPIENTYQTWINMGIQAGAYTAPGWWNGYNESKIFQGFDDYEQMQTDVENDFKYRVGELTSDKKMALEFFSKKNISQWTESTFESIVIMANCSSDIGQNEAVQNLKYGKLNFLYVNIYNLFIMLVYFGAVLYLVFSLVHWKNYSMDEITLMIISLGGFIFYTFWEARGQYTIPFFVILIGYAISGYEKFINQQVRSIDALLKIEGKPRKIRAFISMPLLIVLFFALITGVTIGVSKNDQINNLFKNYSGNDIYQAIHSSAFLEDFSNDQTYTIRPVSGESESFVIKRATEEGMLNEIVVSSDGEIMKARILPCRNAFVLAANDSDDVITVKDNEPINPKFEMCCKYDLDYQLWYIQKNELGQYSLLMRFNTLMALTYDNTTQSLQFSEYTGESNQCFIIE